VKKDGAAGAIPPRFLFDAAYLMPPPHLNPAGFIRPGSATIPL
jgi:hypothetical protein